MVVSFKISRTSTRYRAKPPPATSSFIVKDETEDQNELVIGPSEKNKTDLNSSSSQKPSGETVDNKGIAEISGNHISFTLSLFSDGFSIGKPMEIKSGKHASEGSQNPLYPYDRSSESLFSAIENGRIPLDFLDDIPLKFFNGTIFCEVRDYQKCTSQGRDVASGDGSPTINRICLRMSLANIVRDVPSLADENWTYGDLMEVESRILKILEPKLNLDPTPRLNKVCENPVKINLEVDCTWRKRLRQISDVSESSNGMIQGKKVCLNRISESGMMGDLGSMMHQNALENANVHNNVSSTMLQQRTNSFGSDVSLLVSHQKKYHTGIPSPRMTKDQTSGSLLNTYAASPGGQDMMIPFVDNAAVSLHAKRENLDGQSPTLANKKVRLTHTASDGNLQHLGPQIENLDGQDLQWKNQLMHQQQIARGIQYPNSGMLKNSPQVFEGGLNQERGAVPFTIGHQGTRYNLKEEPVEQDRHMMESDINSMDSQVQSRLQKQRMAQQFMRSGFPQSPWNNMVQPLDNSSRKEDSVQKRKSAQSPRVSAGGLPQSPLSSKSGEFSSSSVGPQFGGVVTSGLVSSLKEKPGLSAAPQVGIGGNPLFSSNANDTIQRQNHAPAVAKQRRTPSLPKTPAMSGVASPASVSNMSLPSPPVGNQPLADQTVLDRFTKIETVAARFQLNCKRNKIDEHPVRKSNTFSAQQVGTLLYTDSNNENLKDETYNMPLSKSLVGGNMNVCKARILNFLQAERVIQGNGIQFVPKARTRMIMSEKPNDGAVAIHIGEIDDAEYLAAEDYLPTLPNTHIADLLAAQFCSLLVREGYHVEDHVQPKPVPIIHPSTSQPHAPGIIPPGSEMQQFSEGIPGQPSSDVAKPSTSGNASSQNAQSPRMLPPGNTQVIQASQGLMPGLSIPSRPPQPEHTPSMQQQPQLQQNSLMHQQRPQLQHPSMMLNSVQQPNNIAQNANIHTGAHIANKPSSLQHQILQQQHQQQPQQMVQSQQQQAVSPQMQRKMSAGLSNIGMGSIGNNMVGLGNLGNVMGIGGIQGVGGTGMSAPMGPISRIGNMNQNPMNLSSISNIANAMRSGTLTPAQAAFMKKMVLQSQNRSNMLANPQSSIAGLPGARPMHHGSTGYSILGPGLNRGNMSQMQRTAMGQMGPPKLMPGMNPYMNLNQQQQQQLQQQQLQQQLQMQQQQQQQQETASPLQAVVSPPPVGSPSSMGIPHQMNQAQQQQRSSPQQMNQRTPMSPQLSSGAIHSMGAANPEACPPASPQLSSQTMGSVSSMTNSPMELQGVNKNSSINNG